MLSNVMEARLSNDEDYQIDFILTESDSVLGQDKSYT